MPSLRLRGLAAAERLAIEKLAHSHTAPARRVERARIVCQAGQGAAPPVTGRETVSL